MATRHIGSHHPVFVPALRQHIVNARNGCVRCLTLLVDVDGPRSSQMIAQQVNRARAPSGYAMHCGLGSLALTSWRATIVLRLVVFVNRKQAGETRLEPGHFIGRPPSATTCHAAPRRAWADQDMPTGALYWHDEVTLGPNCG